MEGIRNEALVVVTGAARGVGLATSLALAKEHGVRVLAISRDQARLQKLQEEGHGLVEVLSLDIAALDAANQIRHHVNGRRVLALVHNAGLLHNRPMRQHQRADLERLFLVNAIAPLEITQALVQELQGDPPGHVVHIGSMGGFQDSIKFPGLVAYSASKAALACMAQCLAEEFKQHGIRTNCLALGSVDTEMLRNAFPGYTAATTAAAMGAYIADFALKGHMLFNGKVLPVAMSTP